MKHVWLLAIIAVSLFPFGCGGGGGFEYNGLHWQVGPDHHMTWYEAEEWVDGLGGDWRMPTQEELIGLWNAGINNSQWGSFENSGWWIWFDETDHGVNFYGGPESWSWPPNSGSISARAFAVRS